MNDNGLKALISSLEFVPPVKTSTAERLSLALHCKGGHAIRVEGDEVATGDAVSNDEHEATH